MEADRIESMAQRREAPGCDSRHVGADSWQCRQPVLLGPAVQGMVVGTWHELECVRLRDSNLRFPLNAPLVAEDKGPVSRFAQEDAWSQASA